MMHAHETYGCILGQLHIGHVRVYTISDCISRMKRMQGFEVQYISMKVATDTIYSYVLAFR
jgi:valyl-tRNA synthetase